MSGYLHLCLAGPGDDADKYACLMMRTYPGVFKTRDAAKAAFLANNGTEKIKTFDAVYLSPEPYDGWNREKTDIRRYMNRMGFQTRELHQSTPSPAAAMTYMAAAARHAGWAPLVEEAGIAIDSAARTGHTFLDQVKHLMTGVVDDAAKELVAMGKNPVQVLKSKKHENRMLVQRLIEKNPKWTQIQALNKTFPSLLPGRFGDDIAGASKRVRNLVRGKQIFVPETTQGASAFLSKSSSLSRTISVLSNGGKVAGWGAPLVVGWYNTATAAPEDQPKTALVEGAGIAATALAVTGVAHVGVAIMTLLVATGAAPVVIVFIATATAAYFAGKYFNELAKDSMDEFIKEAGWEEPLRKLGTQSVVDSSNIGSLLERAD